MFSFFKRKKETPKATKPMELKPIQYDPKVILAWAKAIEGDEKLQDWLNLNGYRELYAGVLAIYLQDKPRDWLMENGYPHLMAMINADKKAAEKAAKEAEDAAAAKAKATAAANAKRGTVKGVQAGEKYANFQENLYQAPVEIDYIDSGSAATLAVAFAIFLGYVLLKND
jgi:hypothetical protein